MIKVKEQKELNRRNSSLKKISLIYIGLFAILIANLIFFIIYDSSNVIINSYNPRFEELEDSIIRGKILDKNSKILAETVFDENKEMRVYPYGNVFSHIVGYSHQGKTGIESLVNFELLRTNMGLGSKVINTIIGKKRVGDNVVTTLDASLQSKAYELLSDDKGAIVVMEPSTGKILAMVSKPDFNPNNIQDDWDTLRQDKENSPLLNRATQGLYPPGSTFKIVTSLAYIRNHDWQGFRYYCDGEARFGNSIMHCYGNTAHGEVDLLEAFQESCNTAFSQIGSEMNSNEFREIASMLLFNTNLPYPLSYSKSSFVLNSQSTIEEIAETSIGQGKTLITPFHNALIVSSIANGGILMKPYIIDRIENANGDLIEKYLPKMYSEMINVEDTGYLTEFMDAVVKEGTGGTSAIDGINVAGKTGSAENPFGDTHAWYVGFAPVEQPRIVVSIIVENAGTSSANAAPIAKELIDLYLNGK